MFANQLEERMLKYESCLSITLPPRLPYILRVGGHCFSSFVADLSNPQIVQIFKLTAQKMHENIQGCVLVYHHCDEFCFLLNNSKNENTQPWCGGDTSKIESLAASMATAFFMHYCQTMMPELIQSRVPIFKSKVFVLPDMQEAQNYLNWLEEKIVEKAAIDWFKKHIDRVQAKMLNSEQILRIVMSDEKYIQMPDESRHGVMMICKSGNWTILNEMIENIFDIVSEIFEKGEGNCL